jgi:hypothetical protein
MTRGWRELDPAIASLIERYAPDLLEAGGQALASAARGAERILRDGRDDEISDEILEERLVDHLLREECKCRH